MSVNKYLPHLLVIPEDEANRQIMTGFLGHLDVDSRQVQVEAVAGGWTDTIDKFKEEHASRMVGIPQRHFLLIIDFDGQGQKRFERARMGIPDSARDRVFVLGVSTEPEELRRAHGKSLESLGDELANACVGGGDGNLWDTELLEHNAAELACMKEKICKHLQA